LPSLLAGRVTFKSGASGLSFTAIRPLIMLSPSAAQTDWVIHKLSDTRGRSDWQRMSLSE
jgi:hypothetical protein